MKKMAPCMGSSHRGPEIVASSNPEMKDVKKSLDYLENVCATVLRYSYSITSLSARFFTLSSSSSSFYGKLIPFY